MKRAQRGEHCARTHKAASAGLVDLHVFVGLGTLLGARLRRRDRGEGRARRLLAQDAQMALHRLARLVADGGAARARSAHSGRRRSGHGPSSALAELLLRGWRRRRCGSRGWSGCWRSSRRGRGGRRCRWRRARFGRAGRRRRALIAQRGHSLAACERLCAGASAQPSHEILDALLLGRGSPCKGRCGCRGWARRRHCARAGHRRGCWRGRWRGRDRLGHRREGSRASSGVLWRRLSHSARARQRRGRLGRAERGVLASCNHADQTRHVLVGRHGQTGAALQPRRAALARSGRRRAV